MDTPFRMNTLSMSALLKRSKTCWKNWRRPNRVGCLRGVYCRDCGLSCLNWGMLPFRLRSKRHSMRRGNLGTCPHEVFPRSERCHQKSVLLSASVPRCYHQGKMQRRLPAGSPGDVESPGSSGRPDSELSHVPPLQTN